MLTQLLLVTVLVALIVAVVLGAVGLARLAALARTRDASARDIGELRGLLEAFGRDAGDHERDIRTDLAIARNEAAGAATTLRQEVAEVMTRQQQGMARELGTMSALQHDQLRAFGERLGQLTQSSEARLEALRATIEQRLDLLRAENTRKLDEMRATVDEKLQATLEQRLGASFRQVSERLEQVHRGLGEMHALATGVGDLKRVLTNVKSRGTWGEVQLGALLADVLTPSQYAQNVATRPGSNERVEFAVRFPGRSDDGAPCWLPIDAKFPLEDWQRLQDAIERADADAVEASRSALEQFFKRQAKSIHDKYVEAPHTTDFAILFVPTEGLFAEAVARPGLADTLQRDYRVTLAGPTNLVAMLNSLQLGFRTLAIEKRSTEVWRVLGAVKTEFGRFGEILARTKNRLDQVGKTLDEAGRKSTTIARKLRDVEALPEDEADRLLTGNERRVIDVDDDESDTQALLPPLS
ncbi:MAG TPA: DNA recombination protein RmuC [Casimicrobiaceae bacterium]|nr:DNA recombination protein RmuC [Casimicrobiaceae bacterium]